MVYIVLIALAIFGAVAVYAHYQKKENEQLTQKLSEKDQKIKDLEAKIEKTNEKIKTNDKLYTGDNATNFNNSINILSDLATGGGANSGSRTR